MDKLDICFQIKGDILYRIMDFIFKGVMNISGKQLGFISDIIVDFNARKINGFVITSNNIFKKPLNVNIKDVVNYTSVMVVTEVNREKYLQFKEIKNMNVVDKSGELIGVVEDILFDREKFSIKAVIISTGFMNNFIKGKKILLIDDLILGDRNLLYRGKNQNIKFFNSVHRFIR
ncbi:MAG: PRC-barrel domain-containing protein [Clostridium luticellarii]|uniref:PRC-barrel domain-containing protein n=1 Tax=Clostridium luticellarii TaxID=1691940 RepID=UPI0023543096|nr:PRC-barrel domain-containing protein [Clostridium luticellarii]MCI1994438.1 PRC-barrel domain-containing protein [Clostridium luticellarii]MCI2038609.1 PRC-barrel domain-containing protein [Clostridium luticellarii]